MKKSIVLFILSTSLTSVAQEREIDLDPVTVTASVQSKKISESGRNLVVFNGDSFSALPVNSIDELLRFLPGVEVQMRGPMGSQSDIVLRGGTFQQVLILLDGVRLNDPNTGHFNSYIPISPAEIDRVEVLKGASSAIYGSEAVGGVIQVITKSFAARQKTEEKLAINGQLAAGEYNFLNCNVGAFYQKNRSAVGGGVLLNHTSGQPQRGTGGFLYNTTASLSMSQYLSDKWQVAVRASYDQRDFGAQNFYTTFVSDTASEKVTSVWTQARLSYTAARHKVKVDIGYKHVEDNYLYNKSATANKNSSKLFQSTFSDEWRVSNTISLVSGFQVISKTIVSNDRGNHQLGQGAIFLVGHYQMIKNLLISPALRLDWNNLSGEEIVPQLNLSYKLAKWQVRASAGKTIRDADFTERYNNYNKTIVTSGSIGNPLLIAETSFSYEAGVDYIHSKAVKVSSSFFQRRQKNVIDWVTTPYAEMPRKDNLVAGSNYALAQNIASVNTTGVEVDIQFNKKLTEHSSLYAGSGLLWMRSKVPVGIHSFYIASHARFLTNFFIEYNVKRFVIGFNGIYKQRMAQQAAGINATLSPEYFVVNGKIAIRFLKDKASLFIQVDNIANKKYSDLLGSVMPRRWVTAGGIVRFKKVNK